MDYGLTPEQGIALEIIFGQLGESPYNREIDDWGTHYKYVYVAIKVPKLEVMHADVNQMLRRMAEAGYAPFEICSFKKGDRYYRYDKFPTSLSRETVRLAWVNSGMRELQKRYKHLTREYRPSC